jgi:hypothetical protein
MGFIPFQLQWHKYEIDPKGKRMTLDLDDDYLVANGFSSKDKEDSVHNL